MDPSRLHRRDLRRLVKDLWDDSRCQSVAVATVDAAVAVDAQSLDRSVITAYLRHFPRDHSSFEHLRAAARFVADRRVWDWRGRGETWQLWDAEAAPKRLAGSMLKDEGGAKALREAGLDGDLAQGRLVAEAITSACLQAGSLSGEKAEQSGRKLINLFRELGITGKDSILAWALLAPWQDKSPSKEYKTFISGWLVERVGDPRLASSRWAAQADALKRKFGLDLTPMVSVLRRWLTEATFRAFFAIVRRTTDREDQWDAREKFWLGYLNAGAVSDAWFAFGREAERQAASLARQENVKFARVKGGADPSHSALLMTIGDLRIAEWSHNGACRFWPLNGDGSTGTRRRAPELYKNEYDGTLLRTTVGPPGFVYRPHMSGWEWTFARIIFRLTGIRHPVHGGA
jgi:hypothetical protein